MDMWGLSGRYVGEFGDVDEIPQEYLWNFVKYAGHVWTVWNVGEMGMLK